jgi:hypothetical protein
MSVRVDLQGISADYFIDRGSALGVMTGQRALLEYQAAGFSSRMRGIFVLMDCRFEDLLRIMRQGASVLACSAQSSSRIRLRKTRFTYANMEKIIAVQAQKSKVLYLLPISNIPNTI